VVSKLARSPSEFKGVTARTVRILVDADACPVKEIILRMAKRRNIPVTMVIDSSHELNDGYSTVVTVDKGSDSADYAITGMVARDDIVVTQDYGLAAMILAKRASAIDQNGMVYTDENIGSLLERRYIGQKIRRGGGRTKGPKKRTREDDERFEDIFARMLNFRQPLERNMIAGG
jgi:uncharacterized protein YaiI (UPF0178 family)